MEEEEVTVGASMCVYRGTRKWNFRTPKPFLPYRTSNGRTRGVSIKPNPTRKLRLLSLVCYNKILWMSRWPWAHEHVFIGVLKSDFFARTNLFCVVRAMGVLEGWDSKPSPTRKLWLLSLVHYNKIIWRRWPWLVVCLLWDSKVFSPLIVLAYDVLGVLDSEICVYQNPLSRMAQV